MQGFLGLTVRDAMTEPVTTVDPDTTVAELEQLIERYDYNSFPVVRDHRLVGIVTKLDFLRNFIFTAASVIPHYHVLMQRRLSAIMQQDVVTVAPDLPLTRVLQMMVDLSSKSFPVVVGDRVVGIVSREDIIRALRRAVLDERT
jgi:CBS-domain-containing membrane protein